MLSLEENRRLEEAIAMVRHLTKKMDKENDNVTSLILEFTQELMEWSINMVSSAPKVLMLERRTECFIRTPNASNSWTKFMKMLNMFATCRIDFHGVVAVSEQGFVAYTTNPDEASIDVTQVDDEHVCKMEFRSKKPIIASTYQEDIKQAQKQGGYEEQFRHLASPRNKSRPVPVQETKSIIKKSRSKSSNKPHPAMVSQPVIFAPPVFFDQSVIQEDYPLYQTEDVTTDCFFDMSSVNEYSITPFTEEELEELVSPMASEPVLPTYDDGPQVVIDPMYLPLPEHAMQTPVKVQSTPSKELPYHHIVEPNFSEFSDED